MHKAPPLLALAVLLLAGCATPPAEEATGSGTTGDATSLPAAAPSPTPTASASPSSAPSAPARMTIRGVVVDTGLRPLAANVTILETKATQHTGPGGAFRFEGLRPDVYFLTATALGHRPQTLSVTPEAARQEVKFQLEPNPAAAAFNHTLHFQGAFECALEVLIITPSCDTLVTDEQGLGRPDLALFNATNTFTVDVQDGWRTVVVDVVFDPSAHPLLDGLRVTVQGSRNQTGLGTYEQYGRFEGPQPFTFRLEPGASYPDGTAGPVPQNTTAFRFHTFPQGHGWHAICSPDGATCFLGVGAGTDIAFDLYVTVFYGKPAPDGFTLA